MVIRASVLLFLLTISAARCWSESLANIPSVDEVLRDAELNMSAEENNIKEENASITEDEAQEIENEEEENSEEIGDLRNEDPEDELKRLSPHSTEESNREESGSDIENEETNDESSAAKQLSDLGISESDLQRVVAEAEEEVKREAPNIPDDSSQTFRRVTHQAKHYRAKYDPESEKRTYQALVMERVMEKLAKKLELSDDEAVATLTGLEIKNENDNNNCIRRISCNRKQRYRTLDGLCNNLIYPCRGSVNTPFRRLLPPDYADKRSKPRESENRRQSLPNARSFTSEVFKDESRLSKSLAHMSMTWGQFIDHDITLSAQQTRNCPTKQQECTKGPNRGECFGVTVPPNDPHFTKVGVKCLHVIRSAPAGPTKCDCMRRRKLIPRQQSNTLTAFIDASQVYGVDEETLKSLRLPASSLLKSQNRILLPQAPPEDFCRTTCSKPCFNAGDERVNENQGLASMHTLFLREHNRIARILTRRKPLWSSNKVFEETRKIIGAQMQHITYNEFLPIILNSRTRRKFGLNLRSYGFYTGYNSRYDPSIINSFSTAAYRFGHSMVRNTFSRPGKSPIPTKSFYNPCPLYKGTGSIFQGLSKDPAQNVDRFFAEALTKFLVIGPNIVIDLPAINIQRGRDHGIPGYNSFRKLFGLEKAKTFADFEGQISCPNIDKLRKFYGLVDNVDLFAGGILETPLPGAVLGPTFSCLVATQFRNLRRGDRFWYENENRYTGFTAAQLAEIRKVSLARLICDNNPHVRKSKPKVMKIGGRLISCDGLPRMNLRKW